MEIIQTTSIQLTDNEKEAINTLTEAYRQCLSIECMECDECPLYVDEDCAGKICERIFERGFERG